MAKVLVQGRVKIPYGRKRLPSDDPVFDSVREAGKRAAAIPMPSEQQVKEHLERVYTRMRELLG